MDENVYRIIVRNDEYEEGVGQQREKQGNKYDIYGQMDYTKVVFLRPSTNLEVEKPERDILNDLLGHILGVELGSGHQTVRC